MAPERFPGPTQSLRGWFKEDVDVSIEKLEAVARCGHVIKDNHGAKTLKARNHGGKRKK